MTELILLHGERALVDDEDLPKVSGFKWYVGTKGYVMAWSRAQRRPVYLHHVVLGLGGHGHSRQVDHRHHNLLDCRKAELRVVTAHQQKGNVRATRRAKASVFKGVTRKNGKWQAGLKILSEGRKRFRYLGCFVNEVDAARAYNEAATAYFGSEFACLNAI